MQNANEVSDSDSLVVVLMGSDEGETWGTEANLKCHLVVKVQDGQDAAVHILRAAQLKEYTELIYKAVHTHTHTHLKYQSGWMMD